MAEQWFKERGDAGADDELEWAQEASSVETMGGIPCPAIPPRAGRVLVALKEVACGMQAALWRPFGLVQEAQDEPNKDDGEAPLGQKPDHPDGGFKGMVGRHD